MNIDPEAAAHAYRERMVGPYRGVLPDASVRSMEEQFSGACTARSRRSTSSRSSWAMPRRPPSSITSSSTPLRPGTRCGCSSCPQPGRVFREQRRRATPAWVRSRASRPSGPSTKRRCTALSDRQTRQRSCSSARPEKTALREARTLEPRARGAGHQEPAARLQRHLRTRAIHRPTSRRPWRPAAGGSRMEADPGGSGSTLPRLMSRLLPFGLIGVSAASRL